MILKIINNWFWIKLVLVVMIMGVGIGYVGYKRSKAPASVLLYEVMSRNNQATNTRINKVETRLITVESRLHQLETTPTAGGTNK
jgi:hypothetical protein